MDKEQDFSQWYTEIKSGRYAGYKYNYRCFKDGSFFESSGDLNSWKIQSGMSCKISAPINGLPSRFSIIDDSDNYVSQIVSIKPAASSQVKTQDKATTETPVTYNASRTNVTVGCKRIAESGSTTGKVKWNAFRTGDPQWFSNSATVILSGRSQNAFGTWIPFTIECNGQGGSVKLVEIN